MRDEKLENKIVSLYHEAFDGLTSKKKLINYESVNEQKVGQILASKYYDGLVNREMILHEIFMQYIAIEELPSDDDSSDQSKKVPQNIINQLIDHTHSKLKRIPVEYEILVPIPDSYPFADGQVADSISIKTFDEPMVAEYSEVKEGYAGINFTPVRLPISKHRYLRIIDNGNVEYSSKMLFNGRHDPVRIFRLFITIHYLRESLQGSGLMLVFNRPKEYTARVYDNKLFVAATKNLVNLNEDLASTYFQSEKAEIIQKANDLFALILTEQSNELEGIRVQITNSLFWFFEYLNSSDLYLQIVYLVSAIDSLFKIKHNKVPNMDNIAPVIAEAISTDFYTRAQIIAEIHKLYPLRNKIVHGGREIQNYRKVDQPTTREDHVAVHKAQLNYRRYINSLLDKYSASL